MKKRWLCSAVFALLGGILSPALPAQETREIRFVEDDSQTRMGSRVYELKYVRPGDIEPYIMAAVRRYNDQSHVRRVSNVDDANAAPMILVTTGREFLPYVDALVKAIDRPCARKDAQGSIIEGTGMARLAYYPKYRATKDLADILKDILGGNDIEAYVNPQTNILLWKDEAHRAAETTEWLKNFDRPLPQVKVRFNYYEVRESDLRDIGFDYLAWKNGPGVNMLNVGYDAGKVAMDEAASKVFTSVTEALKSGFSSMLTDFSTSWGFGGIFTAPQFDMSFIRLLQQSGKASLSANAELTMINTPIGYMDDNGKVMIAKDQKGSSGENLKDYDEMSKYVYTVSMVPEYQNIFKTGEGRMSVGNGSYKVFVDENADVSDATSDAEKLAERVSLEFQHSSPELMLKISRPVICYPSGSGTLVQLNSIPTEEDLRKFTGEKNSGGVLFNYQTVLRNVVERSDTGDQLNNCAELRGGMTIGFGNEKPLMIFEQNVDVKQKVGINFLIDIPVLGYLFGTETSIKVKNYIIVTAEASMVMPDYTMSKQESKSRKTIIPDLQGSEPRTIAEKLKAEQKQKQNRKRVFQRTGKVEVRKEEKGTHSVEEAHKAAEEARKAAKEASRAAEEANRTAEEAGKAAEEAGRKAEKASKAAETSASHK